jgi:hypothetical protein
MSPSRTIEILVNGARGSRRRGPGRCRSCGQSIFWVATAAGRPLPFNEVPDVLRLEGDIEQVSAEHVHFGNCPQAGQWRKPA